MTNLECTVTNCLHNCDCRCCKQTIVVDGQGAQDKKETCCGSFDENKGGAFTNLFKTPEKKLEVGCEAMNCIYNENHRCSADHIGITGDGANEASQTECSSFRAR